METLDTLRLLVPLLLAAAAAYAFDRATARRGLLPPGFTRYPWRRAAGFGVVAGILYSGVFLPLASLGVEMELDLSSVGVPRLFLLHSLLLLSVVTWLILGFAGVPGEGDDARRLPPARRLAEQVGLAAPSVAVELGLGLAAGIVAWLVVLGTVLAVGTVVAQLFGQHVLPREPPAVVPWIAALPVAVRLLVSLSAGFAEEVFFRGLLQPRVGILLSSACFVLAHTSYQEPFMLFGVTLLSLIYAFLVRWRQSIWAAVTAHALFDAVQLLMVIPAALRLLPES